MTDYFYSWITGRVIQPAEESKLGTFLSLFSFFCFPFLFSLLFVEIEIKEEKEYVKVLNKEINDLYGRISSLQNGPIDEKFNAKILDSISFKESQIKDINYRISTSQTRLANIRTSKEGFFI